MDADFDPSVYVRPPKLDVPSAVALSIKLVAATPDGAPLSVKKAANTLRQAALSLQESWKARDRVEKRPDARPVDVLADHAMSRLFGRIEDYSGLPAETHPHAARAGVLLATLFPTGLSFLKADYASQWAETQKRLDRINEEDLAADIDVVTGPEFLAEVRRIHKLYGEAIGITKARPEITVPSLVLPLREVGDAIVRHALQLVSVCLDEEAPLESRTAARDALRPLDEYRANAARRDTPKESNDAVTPETEVPEVPG
ncbi:hypothetical protein KEG38_50035 [Polyangium jinanense]|uniref:hypothetical protein n=1 Tax=Polyangium jinanense TaxID=2829994 RepID=UPI002340075B|nr:hypothetical protein [Polyangium jinanense]MDC3962060.1 hypothetical protein [Polyangium jinanense]